MLGLAVCPFLPSFQLKRLCCVCHPLTIMSFIDEAVIHPAPISSPVEPDKHPFFVSPQSHVVCRRRLIELVSFPPDDRPHGAADLARFPFARRIHQTLLVTIWELGEGIGPFFIAPLSERFGRLPVLHLGKGGGWVDSSILYGVPRSFSYFKPAPSINSAWSKTFY